MKSSLRSLLNSRMKDYWLQDSPWQATYPAQNVQEDIVLFGVPDAVSVAVNTPAPPQPRVEVLVQFNAGISDHHKASAIAAVFGNVVETVRAADRDAGDLVLIKFGSAQAADAGIAALSKNPVITFAENNWSVGAQVISNDPNYTGNKLWGMYGDQTSPANNFGSQAGEAWGAGYTGDSSVVVGVVDSGIDYTHPDLYLNVWLNQGELPANMALVDSDGDALITFRDLNDAANANFVADINGNGRIDAGDLLNDSRWENGIDGNGNGYIDDLIGWDFYNNDNDPFDDNGHGTHVSGTIGAVGGNGAGVVGVNWNVQIMGLKFLSSSGSGSTVGAIKAIDYYTNASGAATAAHYVATNNSWGGGGFSQALLDSIVRGAQQDLLFVAAAGNGGADGIGDNNNSVANYPSNYSTLSAVGYEAVIAVAALTSTGGLASYSNYGSLTVDLGAPGSSILSTVPGGYASYSGTSMATPHVTGALALLASAAPDFTAAMLRDTLLSNTIATTSLASKSVTGGRLDVAGMLADVPVVEPDPDPTPTPEPITNIVTIASAVGDTIMSLDGSPSGTLTLNGTLATALAAGEQLAIYRGATLVGTATVAADNSWSFAESLPLSSTYSYTAQVTSDSQQGPMSSSASTGKYWFYGTTASETLTANELDNLIMGVPATGSNPGRGTIDNLYGGAGADLFVLGDARGRFYDDGRSTNAGAGDYGRIRDFTPGVDEIQLDGTASQYFLRVVTLSGLSGVGIYFDSNANGAWSSRDELVGHVIGVNTLAADDLSFV